MKHLQFTKRIRIIFHGFISFTEIDPCVTAALSLRSHDGDTVTNLMAQWTGR